MKPTKSSLRTLFVPHIAFAGAFLSFALNVGAGLIAPYINDSSTLQLWHLNDAVTPVTTSASGGQNLNALVNGATLNNVSFSGFGSALSTFDGGESNNAAGAKDAALFANAGAGAVTLVWANPSTAAFTYEAMPRSYYRNHSALMLPINQEVSTIQRNDDRLRGLFSHDDETGIGKVHRLIFILLHQAANPFNVSRSAEIEDQGAVQDKIEHPPLVARKIRQSRTRFRDHRLAGGQRRKPFELFGRPVVPLIRGTPSITLLSEMSTLPGNPETTSS